MLGRQVEDQVADFVAHGKAPARGAIRSIDCDQRPGVRDHREPGFSGVEHIQRNLAGDLGHV